MVTLLKLRQAAGIVILWVGLSVYGQAAGLNDAFGIELWTSPSLWSDDASATADRLGIKGNEIGGNAHYKGALDEKETVLGVRAYSVEIYALNGKINKVSIGFVNRADLYNELALKQMEDKKGPNKSPVRAERNRKPVEIKKEDIDEPALFLELEKRMAAEKGPAFQAVVNKLTQRLGVPNDGNTPSLKGWIWSGHRLVAEENSTAVTLKIEPVQATAGNLSAAQKVQQAGIKLGNSVQRKPNGDVVISGIPPISQGDRGYCVPATWEKILRYYGLNFDVYQLAEKGGTTEGGSAFIPFAAKMSASLEKENYAVQFVSKSGPSLSEIKTYVDKGIPLIWAITLPEQDFRDWVSRSEKRTSKLAQVYVQPAAGPAKPPIYHCLSVIGYNMGFQEIALSDSTELGSRDKEIWISFSDATKADGKQGMITVVPKAGAPSPGAVASAPGTTETTPGTPSNVPPGGKKFY